MEDQHFHENSNTFAQNGPAVIIIRRVGLGVFLGDMHGQIGFFSLGSLVCLVCLVGFFDAFKANCRCSVSSPNDFTI